MTPDGASLHSAVLTCMHTAATTEPHPVLVVKTFHGRAHIDGDVFCIMLCN